MPYVSTKTIEKIKQAVISCHLSGYPDGLKGDEIIKLIREDSELVDNWQLFEDWDGNFFAEHIESITDAIRRSLEYNEKPAPKPNLF